METFMNQSWYRHHHRIILLQSSDYDRSECHEGRGCRAPGTDGDGLAPGPKLFNPKEEMVSEFNAKEKEA